MNAERKWHVVYTREGWEKRVIANLEKDKIESYCPIHATHQVNTRKLHWLSRPLAKEPLFNTYVFVYINEKEYIKVIQVDGISNFLYWLGRAIIKAEEIDAIKNYATENYKLALEKIPVNPRNNVRVCEASLIERDGNVLAIRGNCTKIYLPSIGYAISAVAQRNVEIINAHNKRRFFWQLAG